MTRRARPEIRWTFINGLCIGWSACVLLVLARLPTPCSFTPWLGFVSGAPLWGGLGAFVMAFLRACAEHEPNTCEHHDHRERREAAPASMTTGLDEPCTRNLRAPKKTGEH